MEIKAAVAIKTKEEETDFQEDIGRGLKRRLEECLHGISGKFIKSFFPIILTAIELSIQRKDTKAFDVLKEGFQFIGENLEALSLEI